MSLPKETTDKLTWLFLLAPGFISFSVLGWMVDLGQLSEFQITYYSFVLTVVNLSLGAGLLWAVGSVGKRLNKQWNSGTFGLAVVSMLLAVLVGVGLGFAAERDVFFMTLRALPITKELNKRSSVRPTIFLLSQNTRGHLALDGDARPAEAKVSDAFARVTTKSGARYEGWPEFYGLGNERSEIYLSPACEVTESSGGEKVWKVTGPGVILYEDEIRSIVLVDRACSACYLRWHPQPVPSEIATRCKR